MNTINITIPEIEEPKPIGGVLPKNICVNNTHCWKKELCASKQKIHPKWVEELKLCTFHIAKMEKGCTNPKCKYTHMNWKALETSTSINEENSKDFFSNLSMKEIL
jgi:hypothetical protein